MPSYGQRLRMQNVSWRKKGVLQVCKHRKFSALVWAAERIAEIEKKSARYQSEDCVVGRLNPAIL